jgi:hypothetical protein
MRKFVAATALALVVASIAAGQSGAQQFPDPCGDAIKKALAEIATLPADRLKEKLAELTNNVIPLCQVTQDATKAQVRYLAQYAQLLREAEGIHKDWEICRFKIEKLPALLAKLAKQPPVATDLEIRRAEFGNFKQDAQQAQKNAPAAKGDTQGRTLYRCNAIHYFYKKCYLEKSGEILRGAGHCVIARDESDPAKLETGKDVCGYEPALQLPSELQVEYRCKGKQTNDLVTIPGTAKWVPIICDYPLPPESDLDPGFFEKEPCSIKIDAAK